MAVCSQCSAELAANARFCSSCGHPVEQTQARAANEELLRALSGVELTDKRDDSVRCPECGSTQVHAEKRGWSVMAGLISSGKIVMTCLKCGHRFKPGEGI